MNRNPHGRPNQSSFSNQGPQNRPNENRGSSSSGITAPYGFVPLDKIVIADWMADVHAKDFVQDVPFADGVSGSFDLVVEAETPICIAGPRKDPNTKTREMYRLPDQRFAIPGSSLRGALRNVVEIASFGRMHLVNDHRYAVRDLHNGELYGRHMADIQRNQATGKNEPMPLVNAGWLTRREVDGKQCWFIEPCHFAKAEYGFISDFARRNGGNVSLAAWGKKQSSPDKYKLWGKLSLETMLPVSVMRSNRSKLIDCDFGKISDRAEKREPGTFVFTGQPSTYDPTREKRKGAGNPKHHDFFFYGNAREPFEVPAARFKDFEFAHADRGQQGRMEDSPNEEWKFWKDRLEKGEVTKVPIFYLREKRASNGRKEGDLRAFGFAMMFRLANRLSIKEAVANVQTATAMDSPIPDLAEAVFGTVRRLGAQEKEKAGTLMLRGRLLLSHAIEETNARPSDKEHVFVLGAPKASYYPNYVEQQATEPGAQPERDRNGKTTYKTWMDEEARPRGWKRYRPHEQEVQQTQYSSKVKLENVGTRFKPLNKGARFRSRVVIHNLRPMELGALIWALDFGGFKEGRHMLGLARPLGYGRARMWIEKWEVKTLLGTDITPESLRDAFVKFMESRLGNTWQSSWQIKELLALATPRKSNELRYQRLDSDARINEFTDAKKDGDALPRAASSGGNARVPGPETWPTIEAWTVKGDTPGGSLAGDAPATTGAPTPKAKAPAPPPPASDDPVAEASRLGSLVAPGNAGDKVVEATRRFGENQVALKAFAIAAIAALPAAFVKGKADKAYMQWLQATAKS